MNRTCQSIRACSCFWFLVFLFLLIAGRDGAGQAPLPFSVQVQVETDKVVFKVTNQGPDSVLGENLVVEQWDGTAQAWRFAASPLWQCGSKETIFRKPLAAGAQIVINWNKSLHKGCLKAGPGSYQALIKDPQGAIQSLPAEFEIMALVEKVRNPDSSETIYRTGNGECSLAWVMRDAELKQGVVWHRQACSLALKDQAALIAALLDSVIQSGTLAQSQWTLYWGRLTPNDVLCAELPQRLMLATHCSKDWDAKRGKPRQGHENIFVRQIMEQEA